LLLFYALTLLVSAFLLFLVQPLVGKMLLPYMGGTPIVWNTCMVFFQAMLLGGYLYSHLTTKWLGVRKQAYVHLGLLLVTILALITVATVYSQPIAINKDLTPQGQEIPVFGMLFVLLLAVGLPFFTVATSAPLLQKWFANTGHPAAKDPYFLYGASNLGSVLALVAYPIALEPNFRLATQSWVWSAGFVMLAFLIAGCAWLLWKSPTTLPLIVKETAASSTNASRPFAGKQSGSHKVPTTPPDRALTWSERLRWLLLAFVPSSLMLGVTTTLATDIASLPLLWIFPLGIYLMTFIIAFSRLPNWFYTALSLITPVLILLVVFIMGAWPQHIKVGIKIIFALHLLAFLFVALTCHCSLARSRPSASHLTEFYLIMSLGGVMGGIFNALVAPLLFKGVYEYKMVLALACLLLPALSEFKRSTRAYVLDVVIPAAVFTLALFLAYQRDFPDFYYVDTPSDWQRVILKASVKVNGQLSGLEVDHIFAVIVFGVPALLCYIFVERPLRFALCVGGILLAGQIGEYRSRQIYQGRSFFGVLRVTEEEEPQYMIGSLIRKLYHGTTLHGEEQILPPTDKSLPISYYETTGPIGDIFREFPKPREGANLAFIGLGTGTLTAYAEKGQRVTIFEIDPLVKRLDTEKLWNSESKQYETMFSFYNRCEADKRIVLGDARLKLEEQDEQYDMIIVDAFSSDSIPIHLLTQQSIQLYLRKLKDPNGLLVLHISNRYLDLEPIVSRLTDDAHLEARVFSDSADPRRQKAGSHWVAVSRTKEGLGKLLDMPDHWTELVRKEGTPLWTDDYSALLPIIMW
jgi:hypothetical protein